MKTITPITSITNDETYTLPAKPEMYKALINRDSAYDGIFIVGVKTTGIFCRPTCGARKPKFENVEFFSCARDALYAGYRACQRCKPMDLHNQPPEWVQNLIQTVDSQPTVRFKDFNLRSLNIDPARARRYFKQHYGMTFHAFNRARRMGIALIGIRAGRDIQQVCRQLGYESVSGFREAFSRIFGKPPGQISLSSSSSKNKNNGYKCNDPNSDQKITCLLARWLDTPLGAMLAIADNNGLCLLEFVDRRALESQLKILRKRFNNSPIIPGNNEHLEITANQLNKYFTGKLTNKFTIKLNMAGTDFQLKVWDKLLQIPFSKTTSYSQIAQSINHPGSQRAVGKANGDNRIAIIIPCHRVIKTDGTLCGYGGGLWRKKWLLEHERKSLAKSHIKS